MTESWMDDLELFKREVLKKKLDECTVSQQEFFKRVYPRGVKNNKLDEAIELCYRTIAKNNK
jgi:3-methyladenine DNA glycosylase AlkC